MLVPLDLCVLLVDNVRVALKDKAGMFGGFEMSYARHRVHSNGPIGRVRRLLSVGARVLPDPRTSPPVPPLTIAEA